MFTLYEHYSFHNVILRTVFYFRTRHINCSVKRWPLASLLWNVSNIFWATWRSLRKSRRSSTLSKVQLCSDFVYELYTVHKRCVLRTYLIAETMFGTLFRFVQYCCEKTLPLQKHKPFHHIFHGAKIYHIFVFDYHRNTLFSSLLTFFHYHQIIQRFSGTFVPSIFPKRNLVKFI